MSRRNVEVDMIRQPHTTRGRLAVGFALLGSAAAWALHLCLMYFLVQPVCRVGGEVWFHVATVIALLVCIASAITAWGQRRQDADFEHLFNGEGGWTAFVAVFGIAASLIFAYAVVYQWIPVLTTNACDGIRVLP